MRVGRFLYSVFILNQNDSEHRHLRVRWVLEAGTEKVNVTQRCGNVPPPEDVCRGQRVTAAFHDHSVDVCPGYVAAGPLCPQDLRLARVNLF